MPRQARNVEQARYAALLECRRQARANAEAERLASQPAFVEGDDDGELRRWLAASGLVFRNEENEQ